VVDSRVRVRQTDSDVLVSTLRGEVGEAITSWVLLRHFMAMAKALESDDPVADAQNRELAYLYLLTGKLKDELTAKLSELADPKIGRTNFFFVATKLNALETEVKEFSAFVVRSGLREKRNFEIAHRHQPETWPKRGHLRIPYRTLLKATAMAVRLMKCIDRIALGPVSTVQWQRMRKRRYELVGPPRALYLLLPYLADSGDTD
jgi:hypothetical protein